MNSSASSPRLVASPAADPATPDPDPDNGELAAALRSAATRLVRRLRAERPAHGLTMSQISALFALINNGPLTPRALATAERVQPPAATRIVAALEERGLVERTAHPSDGRQVLISPTAAGHRLIADDRRRREAWLAARLAELPAADRDALRAALDVLDRLARS